jgi:hypothetical protein
MQELRLASLRESATPSCNPCDHPLLLNHRMNRRSHILLVALYLCFTGLAAQDTTGTWLNTLEEEANGATATFYRTVWEEEGLWKFREYYRSGDLHKTGQYTDSTFAVKTGTFTIYHRDSIPIAVVQYIGNKRIGPFAKWYRDGTADTKGQYAEAPVYEEADTDDYWNPEVASEQLPAEDEAIKIGRWEYHHPNGQLSAVEEYTDQGGLISFDYWDPDGSPSYYNGATERAPQFPGGEAALMKFLGENVEFPMEDMNAGRSGEVLISFLIGLYGKPTEPRIERTQSLTMNAECLRLIGIMPQWMSARAYNRNEEYRYFLPIRFTNLSNQGQKVMRKKYKGK